MKTEHGNSFIVWKLLVGKELFPDLWGEYWFDPMTGEREISEYAYLAKHMEDRQFPKPYEASLFWKIDDSDAKKFAPIQFSKSNYIKICGQLSKAWKECWNKMEEEYNKYRIQKGVPFDSMYTNHFLYIDNLFNVKILLREIDKS